MTRWLLLSALLTLAAFAGSLYVWGFEFDRLPDKVPIHWDWQGSPDGWTSKHDTFWTFLLAPIAMTGLVALTLVLPWLSPRQFDVDRFLSTYGYLMTLVIAMVGYIHAVVLWGSLHAQAPIDIGRWVVGGIFVMLALTGNVLGRLRRNFWMGVRTPWTLASETVWIQTHRLAAWLFVGGSLCGLAAVMAGAPLAWCFVGFMVLIAFVPIVYSLTLYKRLESQGKL
jgi:uncharacterized membrane protein